LLGLLSIHPKQRASATASSYVAGGTSGIGKATAIAFAQAGAKVAIAERRQPEEEAVFPSPSNGV
jgi:NAD(P)-dependent dehydrogenase (short-subunit alcohol dehydrogenase family)